MSEPARVDALVFSRDRAAQLDLLLRSIVRFAPETYRTVTVLYTHSPEHALSYQLCRQDHPGTVFWAETGFEQQVREWVLGRRNLLAFLVDDDVFYRPAPRLTAHWLEQVLPYSFRAGDYDYPLSVDGVIYRPREITDRWSDMDFADPTQLEAGLHVRRGPLEIIGWSPCLVGIPANVVSPSSNNPHHNIDPGRLRDLYLAGERIDLDRTIGPLLDGTVKPAPHVQLEYHWQLASPARGIEAVRAAV